RRRSGRERREPAGARQCRGGCSVARAPSQAADPGAPALDGAGAGLGPSSVPALVARRAAAGPAAMAAVGGDRALCYGELNRRANQVARHLLALGAGPDTLVACCLERSLDLVVALLGVLKAGAAYVPLDPSYPPDRLAFMLADCRAPVLVTRRPLLGRLPDPSARVVCLDADAAALDRLAGHDVDAAVRPGHLAYVIYTSGSTGRPKGVEVTHG